MFRDLVATGRALRLTEQPPHEPRRSRPAPPCSTPRAPSRAGDLGARGAPRAAHRGRARLRRASPVSSPTATPRRRRAARCAAFIDHWYAHLDPPRRRAPPAAASRCAPADDDELDPEAAAAVMAALVAQQRSRLLTVTRGGFAGADRINADLARRAAADAGLAAPAAGDILPGTPVMITRNDYDRGLYNGDQGVVLSVVRRNGEHRPCAAVFAARGPLVPFPLAGAARRARRRVRVDGTQGPGQRARSCGAGSARRRPAAPVARAGLHRGHARPPIDHRRRPPRAARAGGRPPARTIVGPRERMIAHGADAPRVTRIGRPDYAPVTAP